MGVTCGVEEAKNSDINVGSPLFKSFKEKGSVGATRRAMIELELPMPFSLHRTVMSYHQLADRVRRVGRHIAPWLSIDCTAIYYNAQPARKTYTRTQQPSRIA